MENQVAVSLSPSPFHTVGHIPNSMRMLYGVSCFLVSQLIVPSIGFSSVELARVLLCLHTMKPDRTLSRLLPPGSCPPRQECEASKHVQADAPRQDRHVAA